MTTDDLLRGAAARWYHHTIIQGLLGDYQSWTGRISAQFLGYIFFNKPYDPYIIPIFNVLNAFFFTLIYYFLYKLLAPKQESLGKFLFFIFLINLLFTFNGFFKTAFWKIGGLQYIWGIAIILWFVQKEFFRKDFKKNNIILSFFIGFFIGLYNEIFFALLLMNYLFALAYYYFFDKKYLGIVSKDTLFFNLGNLIGGIILVLAPGNYQRQEIEYGGPPQGNIWEKLCLLVKNILHGGNGHIFLGLIGVVILLHILRKIKEKNKNYWSIFFLLAYSFAHILVFFPIANTGFIARKLILSDLFFFFLLIREFHLICESKVLYSKKMLILWSGLSVIILSVYTYYAYDFHRYANKLIQAAEHAHQKGQEILYFHDYQESKIFPGLFHFYEFTENPDHWANDCFARYYGFKKVLIQK